MNIDNLNAPLITIEIFRRSEKVHKNRRKDMCNLSMDKAEQQC